MYKKIVAIVLVLILTFSSAAFANQPSMVERIRGQWLELLPNSSFYSEGLACININKKYGFVDGNGKVVIQPKYDFALHFRDTLTAVQIGNKAHYVDKTGKEFFKDKYNFTMPFYKGYGAAFLNNKAGLIDKTGKLVLNHEFDYIRPTDAYLKGLAVVMKNNKYGLIDLKTRKYVLDLKFDQIIDREIENKESVLVATANSKVGIFDLTGRPIVPLQYENAQVLNHYLFGIVGGKFSVYDIALKKKIFEQPGKTYEIGYMTKNAIHLTVDSKQGLISALGKVLIPVQQEYISPINQEINLFAAIDGGKTSVYNDRGVMIAPPTPGGATAYLRKDEVSHLDMGIVAFDKDVVAITHQEESKDPSINALSLELGRHPVSFYDLNGKKLLSEALQKSELSYGEYKYVVKDGRMGLSKSDGTEILPAKYEDVIYSSQYIFVKDNGAYRMLDKKTLSPIGQPFTYLYHRDGLMKVGVADQKTGSEQFNFLLPNGKLLFEKHFEEALTQKLPSGLKIITADSLNNGDYKADKVALLDQNNKVVVALVDGEVMYETPGPGKETYFTVIKNKALKPSPLSIYNSKGKLIFKR